MLKILYLINFAGKAGTEKYVYNLIEKFHKKKAECYFVYNVEGLLTKQIKELGVETKRIEMRSPFDLKAARKLADYCKEKKIDVIHAQYPRENYIAVLSKLFNKNVRVVYTSHLTIKTGLLWKITNSIITPKDNKVISVCNFGKKLLIQNGFPEDKIKVIYNGVRIKEKAEKNPEKRKELGISDDTFIMTILARFDESKGLGFLVESIKKLKSITNKKFVLLIAGDGELFDEINEKIKSYGLSDEIKCLGFRRDTEEILAISDLYLNSSKCLEALSFAILEGLVNELPAVVTDVGGNADIISPEHNCGTVVEYGDVDAMAEAICEFMENEEKLKECSENALITAKTVFDLDNLLDDTFKTYLE